MDEDEWKDRHSPEVIAQMELKQYKKLVTVNPNRTDEQLQFLMCVTRERLLEIQHQIFRES